MYSCLRYLCFIALIFVSQTNLVSANRIKDLTSLAGIRSNQLVGYGVVVGLAGSGDGNTGGVAGNAAAEPRYKQPLSGPCTTTTAN